MNSNQYEYNNPNHFMKKIESELEIMGVKIRDIQCDGSAFGSWTLEFEIDNSEYRFLWDNRENWLILQKLMKNEKRKLWEEIDFYRYKQGARTEKQKQELEEFIIRNMFISLRKMNSRI